MKEMYSYHIFSICDRRRMKYSIFVIAPSIFILGTTILISKNGFRLETPQDVIILMIAFAIMGGIAISLLHLSQSMSRCGKDKKPIGNAANIAFHSLIVTLFPFIAYYLPGMFSSFQSILRFNYPSLMETSRLAFYVYTYAIGQFLVGSLYYTKAGSRCE